MSPVSVLPMGATQYSTARTSAHDTSLDHAVPFESPQGGGERLLADFGDLAPEFVEAHSPLAERVEHFERPPVQHLLEELAMGSIDPK